MLSLKGTSTGKFRPIIGIASKESVPFWKRHNHIFIGESVNLSSLGYAGAVTLSMDRQNIFPAGVGGLDLSAINSGDILKLEDNGSIRILWRKGAMGNALFLTSRCDCNCVMCPQPRIDPDAAHFKESWKILQLLEDEDCVCITGGEPTLYRENFLKILKRCGEKFPKAQIDILTNGKNFSDMEFVDAAREIASPGSRFCVSLHSDVIFVHDRITGNDGNFQKTCAAIYNLWQKGLRIEIRVVVTKLNYARLPQIAEFFNNFMPFCEHYVFMAMEFHGEAARNRELAGIDPYEYMDELARACAIMERGGLNVSVYNVPLCMCRPEVWRFARKSVSEWKNIYLEECEGCGVKDECCGFFATSDNLPKEAIKPIREGK